MDFRSASQRAVSNPVRPLRVLAAALILGHAASAASAAGPACLEPANRFRKEVFGNVKQTNDVAFGQNKNPLFNNRQETLMMNIFQPDGDACAKRPLVIFMHGGWMQTGDRNGETGTCQRFAKQGYVAASIEYRLGVNNVFTPKNFGTPGFMATQDARAAIRFFRKNAAAYGIDTNFIYVGGCSAGAYAALFTAYLDKQSEIPSYIDAGALEGGNEGVSGNPGYSSRFNGVLSLSGGVLDSNWIQRGDIPVAAVQCSADPLVPDGADSLRNPNTNVPFLPSFGGSAIKSRATHVSVPVYLQTFQGFCHCPHPGGPGGIDSTLDFFGKSIYSMMTAPATSVRMEVALTPEDLRARAGDGDAFDAEGRMNAPDRFRPGIYWVKKEKARR
jgi:dienelactone hydrolase